MNTLQSIIIAIIEGITEFLPISSTAHMKFANPFLGIESSPFVDLFEIVIQLAAIASVVVIYRKKFFDFKHFSFYIKLIIAVIPALIFGALLKKYIDAALGNLWVIAIVMVAGGVILIFIDKFFEKAEAAKTEESDQEGITYKKSFIIGCFQVLSILFPGLSRSAATIIGGMSQQLNKKTALEFSFFFSSAYHVGRFCKKYLRCLSNQSGSFWERESSVIINRCSSGLSGGPNKCAIFYAHCTKAWLCTIWLVPYCIRPEHFRSIIYPLP